MFFTSAFCTESSSDFKLHHLLVKDGCSERYGIRLRIDSLDAVNKDSLHEFEN